MKHHWLMRLGLAVWLVTMLAGVAGAANPYGRLDTCDAEYARGYAKDTDAPNGGQIYVHFYLDAPAGSPGAVFLGSTFANQAYSGIGNNGFVYAIPPSAHAGPGQRKIYVHAIDYGGTNNLLLTNSGMTMGDMLYLDNGTVRVGIKLTWGGAITEVTYGGANVVDAYDAGREVQCAFYAAGESYYADCGDPRWGWDPVQAGDKYKHGSGIVNWTRTGNTLYIQTRPMEWNPDNKGGGSGTGVRSTVTLDQWITISGRVVYLDYGVQNDATARGYAFQEMPCIYTPPSFKSLIGYYGGTDPWNNGAMTTTAAPAAAQLFTSPEYMLFMGNSAGTNGITMLNTDNSQFYGFVAQATDPGSCGYVRCNQGFAIPANGYVSRSSVIIPGDYTSARTLAYGLGIGQRNWNFNTNGNFENWQPNAIMTGAAVNNGVLSATSTGIDPFMYSPDTNLCAAVLPTVEARLAVSAGTVAQLFFITDDDQVWDEAKSVTATITPDGQYRSVYFDLASNNRWAGRIRQLRLDPTNAAGTINIDYVRALHNGGQQWMFDTAGNAEGWTAWNQITGLTVTGGALTGTASGGDPYMGVTGLGLEAGALPQIELRMKLSAGTQTDLYFATDVDGNWDEAKKFTFTPTADNQYHTYFLSTTGNAKWQGKVLGLRLDPTATSGATFAVDYMRIVSTNGAVWNFNTDNLAEGWIGGNAGAYTVSGGTLNFTSTNTDPQFALTGADAQLVNADLFKTMQITMKTATPSGLELFFNRSTDPVNFDAARYASLTLVSDNTMRTYNLDLRTNANWNGLIRDLRVDPLTAVGSANIDSIKFLP